MGVVEASLGGMGGGTSLLSEAGVELSGELFCDTVECIEASDVAMGIVDVAKGVGNEETGNEAGHDEESSDVAMSRQESSGVAMSRLECGDVFATRGMATVDASIETGECEASLGEVDDDVALLDEVGIVASGDAWCSRVTFIGASDVALALVEAKGAGNEELGDEAGRNEETDEVAVSVEELGEDITC